MTISPEQQEVDAASWRRWLVVFLLLSAVFGAVIYAAVVAIDPFNSGRYALMQGEEVTIGNLRLVKGGVARNPRFDAAIFGSSTGYALDPQKIGNRTGWTVAQLGLPAALPPSQLLVARTFQRERGNRAVLHVYILDDLWCRPGDPGANPFGPFPDWLYEIRSIEYLSRILSSESVAAAARRLAIRAGVAQPLARGDGFMAEIPRMLPREQLAAMPRPSAAPSPDKGFPAVALLAAHVKSLPASVGTAFVFAPPYVNMLPVPGSTADARLAACKAAVRQIADSRPNGAYLDLMQESPLTRSVDNFFDTIHYTPAAADAIAAAIADALRAKGLVRP